MNLAKYPKQSSWQIIYKGTDAQILRAVEFLSREAGKLITRREGEYSLFVLPCEKEGTPIRHNALIIGKYNESPLIQSLVRSDNVPEHGHSYSVMKRPDDPEARYVVMTGHTADEVYAAAVDFIDRYIYESAPNHGTLKMPDQIFAEEMKEAFYSASPKSKTRGIFTWGVPINDYRKYIRNMARMKLNQIILWNDFVPFNAKEIIEYAHSFGIEIMWGYSWGWNTSGSQYLENIGRSTIDAIKAQAISDYENCYRELGGDGIYFQSFTERHSAMFGDVLIAEAVSKLVNETAGELLEKYPDLHIQFGLHASSVLDHLEYIATIDKRVEIVWEDFGCFPSHYVAKTDEEKYEKLIKTTDKLINLRGDAPLGFIVKGFMILDWEKERFVHQEGPFVLGDNDEYICEHDKRIRDAAWRIITSDFLKYGDYMRRFTEYVSAAGGGNVNLCMAGTFDGGIHLPESITASLIYGHEGSFDDAVLEESRKTYVTLS